LEGWEIETGGVGVFVVISEGEGAFAAFSGTPAT
jgi:hypothetical protein